MNYEMYVFAVAVAFATWVYIHVYDNDPDGARRAFLRTLLAGLLLAVVYNQFIVTRFDTTPEPFMQEFMFNV